ncbi:MAG: CBS domain-containing protein [Candidatus Helarchaeota archaeon]
MQKEVVYAEVPGTREEVMAIMQESNVKAMPVVKKGTKELVGIISQTDLLLKPDENQLALLMSRDPIQISPTTSIRELVNIMLEKNLRRLPVTQKKEVVGMVSIGDIIKAISRMSIKTPIKDLVNKKIQVIWEGSPLSVVPTIMRLAKTRTLPCIDDNGALSGIISDLDFIKESKIVSEEKASSISSSSDKEWSWETSDMLLITKKKLKLPNKLVKEVMTKNLITINEFTAINECASRMYRNKIDQIPVLDAKGELIGLIEDETLVTAFHNMN